MTIIDVDIEFAKKSYNVHVNIRLNIRFQHVNMNQNAFRLHRLIIYICNVLVTPIFQQGPDYILSFRPSPFSL